MVGNDQVAHFGADMAHGAAGVLAGDEAVPALALMGATAGRTSMLRSRSTRSGKVTCSAMGSGSLALRADPARALGGRHANQYKHFE